MKVKLKYSWFAPEGYYFDKGIQIIPDRFKTKLPSSAEVIGEAEYKAPPAPEEGTILRHVDGMRAAADAEAKIMQEAEEAYQANVKNKGKVKKEI